MTTSKNVEEITLYKMKELSNLRNEIISCRKCNDIKMPNIRAVRVTESSLAPVPGSGNVNAKYMFIGEAPGEDEDEIGEGFRGRSGQYLRNKLIPITAGLDEEDCYFCNIIRCHPMNNRDPYKVEIKTCLPYLLKEIEIVNPDVIFTVGKIATETLLGMKISESHGNIYSWNGRLVMPLYHPAGVDRAVPRVVLEKDYQTIKAKLKQGTEDGEIRLPDYSKFRLVRNNKDLLEFLNKLGNITHLYVSLDIETIETEEAVKSGSPDPITNQLAGLSVTFKDDIDGILSYYIPTAFHIPSLVKQDDLVVFYQDFDSSYTSWDDFIVDLLGELEPLLSKFTVYIHNAKFEMESLEKYGFTFPNPYCTMIAGYTLREQSLGLKSIIKSNYGVQMTELEDLIDLKKQTVIETRLSEFWKYGCADTFYCFKYGEDSRKKIKERNQGKFFEIAHGLLPWVVQQELEGVYIDEEKREELRVHFNNRLREVERDVYSLVGEEFNLNSPEKVAEVLFSKEYLGIDPPTEIKRVKGENGLEDVEEVKFTSSGKHISTNKNDLKPISYRHEAVGKIVEHGSLSTIKSTFIDGIPGKQHWKTGRLHPSINQTVTATSRLSYSKWNGQNLPVRTEESKRIREMITVEDLDWWMWSIDQCLAEGTLVETPYGDTPIEDLETGSIVFSYDNSAQIPNATRVVAKKFTGYRECYKVLLDSGKSFTATKEHKIPVITQFGEYQKVPLKNVSIGNRILPFKKQILEYGRTRLYSTSNRKYVQRAHIIAAEVLGERPAGCDVNHINGAPDDDRPENLEYKEKHLHQSEDAKWNYAIQNHHYRIERLREGLKSRRSYKGSQNPNYGKKSGVIEQCWKCKKEMYLYPSQEKLYCSRKCYAEARIAGLNEKVVEVILVGVLPTWDIQVNDDSHLFALSCGVYTSNSQIELRYAAHVSQDQWMIDVLSDPNRSIHEETCTMIYGLTPGQAKWDYFYKNSKNGNFARLFGAGKYKLAETLECPLEEAEFFLQEHSRLMRGFAQWVERQKLSCKAKGYVRTWAGFIRYIPEIQSKDRGLRSRGERLAVNVPIQGGAQHHIQKAMGEIFSWFEEEKFESRMKLQIHDELDGFSPIDELVEVAEGVAKRLEFANVISVPTPVNIEVGKSLGELVDWEEWKRENL